MAMIAIGVVTAVIGSALVLVQIHGKVVHSQDPVTISFAVW